MERRRVLRMMTTVPVLAAGAATAGLPSVGLAARPSPARPMIVIDAGHGGSDPGAIGVHGTFEKTLTLDIALDLAERLATGHGVAVALTRESDRFMPLGDRVAFARSHQADLFVSIHADSAPTPDIRGLSAYTLSEKASDSLAGALARRENAADGPDGLDLSATKPEVREILFDLATRHARTAAQVAQRSLLKGVARDLRLLDKPQRSAAFAILSAPDVPSLLIETGFLSNPDDEEFLRRPDARRSVAAVLARELSGIVRRAPFT